MNVIFLIVCASAAGQGSVIGDGEEKAWNSKKRCARDVRGRKRW